MATAAEIASESQCSVCLGTSLFEAMQITILRNILDDAGVTMTQQEINDAASCFVCLGMSLAQAQILALLNEFASSGGGGGGAALDVVGDPNGVLVADHNQFAWDETNKVLWINEGADGSTGPWHQIV